MPDIPSAAISMKLVQALGAVAVVGPTLVGLSRAVQVCGLGDSPARIITMATLAAFGAQTTSWPRCLPAASAKQMIAPKPKRNRGRLSSVEVIAEVGRDEHSARCRPETGKGNGHGR